MVEIVRSRSVSSRWKRAASIGSRIALALSALAACFALFVRWAVDAEAIGAHDLGAAILFVFAGAAVLVGIFWAAPALALVGIVTLRFDRSSGVRLLAAAVLCSIPLLAHSCSP